MLPDRSGVRAPPDRYKVGDSAAIAVVGDGGKRLVRVEVRLVQHWDGQYRYWLRLPNGLDVLEFERDILGAELSAG